MSVSADAAGAVLDEPSLEAALAEVAQLNTIVDPEETPFESKYKAREILTKLQISVGSAEGLVAKIGSETEDEKRRRHLLGRVQEALGVNHIDTEELGHGEKLLLQAQEMLADEPLAFAAPLLESCNYLGCLYANRNQDPQAHKQLERAIDLYGEYSKSHNINKIPQSKVAEWRRVESLHTLTLFYLAQVYGHLQQPNESAKYCHMTLNRQLESKEFDPKDWTTNCMQLSYYYMNKCNFRQAFHLLQAADCIRPLPDRTQNDGEEEDKLGANLQRAWGGFYLILLKKSVQKLAGEEDKASEEEESKEENKQPQNLLPAPDIPLQLFKTLKLSEPPAVEFVTTFDGARDAFKNGLSHFTKAAAFFVLDGFVTEHIAIQQDISQLYKYLICFEPDLARKCKMTKRRIDLLEPLVTQLNATVYGDFVKQLTDEVARCYGNLADLKCNIVREQGRKAGDDPEATEKINQLILSAVQYHRLFVRSFDKTGKEEPDVLAEDYHEPYLAARFEIARWLGRIIVRDIPKLLEFQQLSLKEFEALVKFAQKHNVKVFKEELEICKQMTELIPLKMQRIRLTGRPFDEY